MAVHDLPTFCCHILSHVFASVVLLLILKFHVLDIICPIEVVHSVHAAGVRAGCAFHGVCWPTARLGGWPTLVWLHHWVYLVFLKHALMPVGVGLPCACSLVAGLHGRSSFLSCWACWQAWPCCPFLWVAFLF